MTPQECLKIASWLINAGHFDMAIKKCDEALKIDEFYAPAHWSRCFIKMLQGDLSQWAKYEWYDDPRYSPQKGWFKRRVNCPVWKGESLKNKKIFLYCDEGYGDYFQFLRYVTLIKKLGAYTIVECLPYTKDLTATCEGIDCIIDQKESLQYDFHCPLMLAPVFFDIANYIHSGIYLSPPSVISDHLYHYLSIKQEPSIGVVWKGNPKHSHDLLRSINPSIMKNLKTNYTLISLQHNEYEDGFINIGMMLKDWSDTAHVISKMNLIITVDTAVAHLAGAMGKEVWLLLQKYPDWRWGLNTNYTPWYPSVKLFRKQNSWEQLINQVNENLKNLSI